MVGNDESKLLNEFQDKDYNSYKYLLNTHILSNFWESQQELESFEDTCLAPFVHLHWS